MITSSACAETHSEAYLVRDDEEYRTARRVLELLDDDYTWARIEEETGVPQGTIGEIKKNAERYSDSVDRVDN